ncbi:hypothetical protein GJAV_G00122600 [Gymnothorax javanicus]|nr:hypothetical protein GJAV_G00122600 [Gymnothorax javanicus]
MEEKEVFGLEVIPSDVTAGFVDFAGGSFAFAREAAVCGCHSMATRTEKLARPKPNHLRWPDRRSVYWLDTLPRRREGPTTFELTHRWLALCESKQARSGYQENWRSPVWEVSSAALTASASERVCSLAKPRPLSSGWQPSRPLLSKPTPSALTSVPSVRVCELACPKQEISFSAPLENTRPSLSAQSARALSARIQLLSVPKPTHPQYEMDRPVMWIVPAAARKAVISDRVRTLARPIARVIPQKEFDPFTVRPAAGRASASPRILKLSEPLPRKCWHNTIIYAFEDRLRQFCFYNRERNGGAGPMGSGEGTFALAEILGHGYVLPQDKGLPQQVKPLEVLEKSLATTRADEMPLEELLALYGYQVSDPRDSGDGSEPGEIPALLPEMTLDKDQIAKDLLSEEEMPSPPDDLTSSVTTHPSDLFRLHLQAHIEGGESRDHSSSESDEDSDDGSTPSSEGRKDIMVGPQYQASIPPLSHYSCQERAYENEDQLLWLPGVLSGEAVEDFLLQAQGWGGQEGAPETPNSGNIIRDSEQALYELVKCHFNMEEALRRLRFNVKVFREELCAWSEEECRNFEQGYRAHGKNFHLIQANKVRTRSVGECVEYYYAWKKSERHDYFTLQTSRLGRRKYNPQAGNMDDGEQDGDGGSRSQSPPQGPGTAPQLDRASPPEGPHLDLEKPEEEPASSPPQVLQMQTLGSELDSGHPNISPPTPAPPTELFGPGFYQLQLEPLAMPAVTSQFPSSPVFGGIEGFLCASPVQHPRSLTQPALFYGARDIASVLQTDFIGDIAFSKWRGRTYLVNNIGRTVFAPATDQKK